MLILVLHLVIQVEPLRQLIIVLKLLTVTVTLIVVVHPLVAKVAPHRIFNSEAFHLVLAPLTSVPNSLYTTINLRYFGLVFRNDLNYLLNILGETWFDVFGLYLFLEGFKAIIQLVLDRMSIVS